MDSGVGGLSVYREVVKLLPAERYIYYADNANCPYGEKTAGFIIDRCFEIVDLMVSKGAQVVVVACNTATAAAIAALRAHYDIPFIGMEPAVKPAAMNTRSGVIGVLATAGTLKASKYLMTRGRFEEDVQIIESVGQGFVELVESGELEGERAESVVRASLRPLIDAGADTIVLGCTHYPFLLPVLRKVAAQCGAPDVRFIDPAPAVARQLVHVMDSEGIAREAEGKASLETLSSGPDAAIRRIMLLLQKNN